MNLLTMLLGKNKSRMKKDIYFYLSSMKYGLVATADTVAEELGISERYFQRNIDENIKKMYSFKMVHGGTTKRFFCSKKTLSQVMKFLNRKA